MRCSSSSVFVTITALLVLATCSPLEDSDGTARISLRKHGSFTKDDGSFDMDSAIEHTVFIRNKYRQNLINAKRNIGEEAFNAGAEIAPLATLPDHLQTRRADNVGDRDEQAWICEISIGIPPQSLTVKIDTGDADLWVTSESCDSNDVCPNKRRYSADASATCQEEDGDFEIKYQGGSEVHGPVFSDKVTVGGIVARSQFFSPVTSMSSGFRDTPYDGILGMAQSSISYLKKKPFLYTALAQGAVPRGEFAFYISSNYSELFLGGTNPARYYGDIEYHKVTSGDSETAYYSGLWRIGGATFQVNDKVLYTGHETIIDTGTPFIYGHVDNVKDFFDAVPGSSVLNTTDWITFYSYPCNNPPDFQISWGGIWWPVDGSTFNQGETSPGSEACVSSMMGLNQGLNLNRGHWALGDSFMENVYTVFNIETNSVGFAIPD